MADNCGKPAQIVFQLQWKESKTYVSAGTKL